MRWRYCLSAVIRGYWMLEYDRLKNVLMCAIIVREMHGKSSSRQVFDRPHYMSISLHQIISVFTAKEPKPTTTLAKQINIVNNMIKKIHCFCDFATKICLIIIYRKQYALSLALSPLQTHTHTVYGHTWKHTRTTETCCSDNFIIKIV